MEKVKSKDGDNISLGHELMTWIVEPKLNTSSFEFQIDV